MVNQIKTRIANHVNMYCAGIYDDPMTGNNKCYLLGGIDCIAIYSQFSILEGKCPCIMFNTLPPLAGLKAPARTKKACARCKKLFLPRSNHQKYCNLCAEDVKRSNARKRKYRQRHNMTV